MCSLSQISAFVHPTRRARKAFNFFFEIKAFRLKRRPSYVAPARFTRKRIAGNFAGQHRTTTLAEARGARVGHAVRSPVAGEVLEVAVLREHGTRVGRAQAAEQLPRSSSRPPRRAPARCARPREALIHFSAHQLHTTGSVNGSCCIVSLSQFFRCLHIL